MSTLALDGCVYMSTCLRAMCRMQVIVFRSLTKPEVSQIAELESLCCRSTCYESTIINSLECPVVGCDRSTQAVTVRPF